MTNEERAALAELFREDDRLRAEHVDWMARRNSGASPSMRKSDDEAVLYRTTEQTAPQPATEPQPDWSQWEAWMAAHLANERAQILDLITAAMGMALAEERKTARTERDAELLRLRSEIAELRGKTDALLSMLQMKGGDIVDLPDWRKRHA